MLAIKGIYSMYESFTTRTGPRGTLTFTPAFEFYKGTAYDNDVQNNDQTYKSRIYNFYSRNQLIVRRALPALLH